MPESANILEFRKLAEGETVARSPIISEILPIDVHGFLDDLIGNGPRFLLSWQGAATPEGIKLPDMDVVIGEAHGGVLRNAGGEHIGFYDALEEYAGPDKDRHAMVITLG